MIAATRMRDRLRTAMDRAYLEYDERYLDRDPLQFARGFRSPEDREVVGFLAAALAYGNVVQIRRSIRTVLDALGPHPAQALERFDARRMARRLEAFKHRFNDGRDVACLLRFVARMRRTHGSVEAFFAPGHAADASDVGAALTSFAARALAQDHGGLYGDGPLPARAGVRFFFSSPADGSACKRQNLFLRWMVRRGGVDLGVWRAVEPRALVIPLDAHVYGIARRVRLTSYRSPGWAMALDITKRLRRLDPDDPVKYDFALFCMGLTRQDAQIRSLA
jgi:uncharacterized protein (TIGR02757 family)